MTPSYRSIGGDLVYGGRFRTREWFEAQADLAWNECVECRRLGDREGARIACKMFLDITDAIQAQADWMRCTRVAA